jgi:hypothetical protein
MRRTALVVATESRARAAVGPAAGGAFVVEGAVAGDGGDPAAEAVVVAVEGFEVAGDLEPGFGGDVFGVVADDGAQVAQEAGLGVAVEGAEGVGVAPLRPGHQRGEPRGRLRLRFRLDGRASHLRARGVRRRVHRPIHRAIMGHRRGRPPGAGDKKSVFLTTLPGIPGRARGCPASTGREWLGQRRRCAPSPGLTRRAGVLLIAPRATPCAAPRPCGGSRPSPRAAGLRPPRSPARPGPAPPVPRRGRRSSCWRAG